MSTLDLLLLVLSGSRRAKGVLQGFPEQIRDGICTTQLTTEYAHASSQGFTRKPDLCGAPCSEELQEVVALSHLRSLDTYLLVSSIVLLWIATYSTEITRLQTNSKIMAAKVAVG